METPALDLNLLRTFLAVYRSGSFTGAARVLGLSQPTVTTQMRALERQTGRELFERLPRGVTPTPVADELAARIAAPLDDLAVVAGPTPPAGTRAEPVHLAGPAEFLCTTVLPALAPLVAEGLRLRVSTGLTDPLLEELRAGRHDLVIATTRPRGRTVHAVPLADEEFVLVASPVWADRLRGRQGERNAAAGGPAIGDPATVGSTTRDAPTPGSGVLGTAAPGSATPDSAPRRSADRVSSVPDPAPRGSTVPGAARPQAPAPESPVPEASAPGPAAPAASAPGPTAPDASAPRTPVPTRTPTPSSAVLLDPAVLHDVPLVTYAEDLPIARRYWRHVFGRRLSRTAAVTVPDLRGVLAAVAGGAGFSVLPRYLCQDLLASGALVALLEPEDPPINTSFLVRRPGACDNPDVARVHDLLLRAAPSW
ncbi:LysR substrate-binding domain-containing protein [Streptomyces sp. AGS-58]|uniref:LysR substrate-binding domain-containing protein n=1 Tax=unclassified Streptomyces TaxID=2593676 RepID=UPI0035A30C7F